MRIYDPESKKSLHNIFIFLTPEEADELGQSARDLAKNPEKHHHHVPDLDGKREIMVAVYTYQNLANFDAESRKIINDLSA